MPEKPIKPSKGYQLDEDEQMRLSSMPGVTVYTLGSALLEAMYPVYEYFLKQTGCTMCAALATEREVSEALPDLIETLKVNLLKFCKDHEAAH
jgi:hypothetical protein